MTQLSNLRDTHKKIRQKKRVGRGPSSGKGKTCSRGSNGAGSRSGYTRRYGYEGGQMRLFTKLPIRGFTRGRFAKTILELNLFKISDLYKDGETVSLETLHQKGQNPKQSFKFLKILGNGEIDKKVSIEAHSFSKGALKKLDVKKVKYKQLR